MSKPRPSLTVGRRLREARERKGISLRQVAEATRISVMTLEAIERDDVKRLPGGIFIRSFIRSYALEVGLSPDRLVEDFLSQSPREPDYVVGPGGVVEDNQAVESGRRMAETILRLALLSLPIAGLVVYFGAGQSAAPASEASPVAVERLASDAAQGRGGALERAAIEPDAPRISGVLPTASAPAVLTITIEARTDCWVSPTVDGEKAPSALLPSGERRELRALREILLTVGDGEGCAYTVNGRPGRPFGASGEVVTRRITLENYGSYVSANNN